MTTFMKIFFAAIIIFSLGFVGVKIFNFCGVVQDSLEAGTNKSVLSIDRKLQDIEKELR